MSDSCDEGLYEAMLVYSANEEKQTIAQTSAEKNHFIDLFLGLEEALQVIIVCGGCSWICIIA